jgi:hypothetical protein
MNISIYNFFNLKKDYTFHDLYKSYNNKISDIHKFKVSDMDKEFYKNQVKNIYDEAFMNLFNKKQKYTLNNCVNINNLHTKFSRINLKNKDQDYPIYESYKEFEDENNMKIIIKENKIIENNEVKNIIITYKENEKGDQTPIDYLEAIDKFNKKRKLE